jgi:hypothetical protein
MVCAVHRLATSLSRDFRELLEERRRPLGPTPLCQWTLFDYMLNRR